MSDPFFSTPAPRLPRPIDDPVTTLADITGHFGRAWRVRFVRADFSCGSYVIEAPWADPHCHSYFLSVNHLRDVAGHKPATIFRNGATHELILFALDPRYPRQDLIDGKAAHVVTPPHFAAQLCLSSDRAAEAEAARATRRIVQEALSPSGAHQSAWIAYYGDSMMPIIHTAPEAKQ